MKDVSPVGKILRVKIALFTHGDQNIEVGEHVKVIHKSRHSNECLVQTVVGKRAAITRVENLEEITEPT